MSSSLPYSRICLDKSFLASFVFRCHRLRRAAVSDAILVCEDALFSRFILFYMTGKECKQTRAIVWVLKDTKTFRTGFRSMPVPPPRNIFENIYMMGSS